MSLNPVMHSLHANLCAFPPLLEQQYISTIIPTVYANDLLVRERIGENDKVVIDDVDDIPLSDARDAVKSVPPSLVTGAIVSIESRKRLFFSGLLIGVV